MFESSPASGAVPRIALARARAAAASLDLVVDLASEPIGPRWFRGAATLACLCAAAIALTPGIDPVPAALARNAAPPQTYKMNAMLGGNPDEQALPEIAPPLPTDPLAAAEPVTISTPGATRVQGAVTEGIYWSLREAGVSPDIAAAYLNALSTRIDVGGDVAPFDRYDLVVSKDGGEPHLVYAALHRVDGPDVELMKWNAGGRVDWFDTDASGAERSDGLMAPVAGRITSRFGSRVHPILRFARMHSGIDFGAGWGSPIVAAADGQVVGAGWSGGYGRQVRVEHADGIVTTYSHMSGFAASPGETVRQGQVIGYVGSSGLSTGPHLHFEVRMNGQAVDPLQVQLQRRQQISGPEKRLFDERLKQLLSIGSKA